MLDLGTQIRRRRIGLTPMIDVVFLLLVFFMLAARFGATDAIPVGLAGTGAPYEGPPRLVTLTPDAVLVNGILTPDPVAALGPLMSDSDDTIILRTRDDASVQRLLDVMGTLRAAGWSSLVVLE